MVLNLSKDWEEPLKPYLGTDSFQQLIGKVTKEYDLTTVYPPKDSIFRAFNLTPYDQVKVCILGQDPYHGPNQANGLSFSVQPGIKIPPSLKNIYKELESDLGIQPPNHGDLTSWANQGVLLLNSVLTVRRGQANSHKNYGWEELTDLAIKSLNDQINPVVFILWGRQAQAKKTLIDTNKHAIITSSHPSPLSAYRGFLGSKPFSQTNAYLEKWQLRPINWEIPTDNETETITLF